MKRLLLGPALIVPLALFGCSNWGTKVPELPKVPEVVRQIPLDDFDHFPPIVTAPAPQAPVVKHKPHQVKKHADHPVALRPAPARRPRVVPDAAPSSDVPDLPPQQGPICIFPFSMIPNCTPQVAGQ
jgi:hypothetical protein